MKTLSGICLTVISLAVFFSCNKEETTVNEEPYEVSIDVKPDSTFQFEALQESFELTLTAEGPWKIEAEEVDVNKTKSLADWIKISITSGGSGVFGIEIGLTPNLSLVTRIAHLILYHQKKTQKWTITQQPSVYETDGLVSVAVHRAGTLREYLQKYFRSLDNVKSLRVIGTLNEVDVNTLYSLQNLNYLDLQRAVVPASFRMAYHRSIKTLLLPDHMVEIVASAFHGNTSLEYVYGKSVIIIGEHAFSGCEKLENYYLPEVEAIGSEAFSSCKNLTYLVFQKLKQVGNDAFRNCSSVAIVSLDVLEEIDNQLSGWDGPSNIELINLPSLTKAGNNAFSYQKKLKVLGLPKITTIGYSIIQESSVEELNFPSIREIPEHAFSGNTSLRRVYFENAKIIRAYAFDGCERLKDVLIPKVEQLDGHSFYGCTLGGELDFSSVKFIGQNCFEKSTGLGSHVVKFPIAINIGSGAFQDCIGLVSIEIPLVTSIGEYAFYGCEKLMSIAGDNTLWLTTSIGKSAFCNCKQLRSLDFPILTSLDSSCFDGSGLYYLSFGLLDWKRLVSEDDPWPAAPFEHWNFPIDNTSANINLKLGVSPGEFDITKPWWQVDGDNNIMFMHHHWASVNGI